MKELVSLGLKHQKGRLLVLDQELLPHRETWIEADSPERMIACIKALKVRGAPLIGVAAALSLAKFAESGASREEFFSASEALSAARPTAVNLMAACKRMGRAATEASELLFRDVVIKEAEGIFEEDVRLSRRMAENGLPFVQDGDSVLTHCNTGGLATAGIGTALGVIRLAHQSGRRVHVYVDETRPLLQGARLTAWELEKLGIPYTLLSDNAAADLMRAGLVGGIFVGADRIAANGDFANKVGTYGLAVSARFHGVPFYCVAPQTTVDMDLPNGEKIPIEKRAPEEVRRDWAPREARVYNPAFDVTPAGLLTALVLDSGVFPRAELASGALSRAVASPT